MKEIFNGKIVDKLRLRSDKVGIYKLSITRVNNEISFYHNCNALINTVQGGKDESSGDFLMKSHLFLKLIGGYFQMFG